MMRQYLAVKADHPDALLFYRMGDFYELFFEDAETAARVLELTLTSRNKKDANPIPMCGVPVRAAQTYLGRLIRQGYKVAICEQVTDPAAAKGLVEREVVRVITPGMIVEDGVLDDKSNNYILAVSREGARFGLACLDISTGTFRLTESDDLGAVIDESLRVGPSEVLLPQSFETDPELYRLRGALADSASSFLEDAEFEYAPARHRLMEQFDTLNLAGFGCEALKAGVGAAGAILAYVVRTQKQPVAHIRGMETYQLDGFLFVDPPSARNLELTRNLVTGRREGSLIAILDRSCTPMGGRLLKRWLAYPLTDVAAINRRLDAVAEALEGQNQRRELRETLKSVQDLERLGAKLCMGHGNARDLLALKRSLQTFPRIRSLLADFESEGLCWGDFPEKLAELADPIERAVREDAPLTVQEGGIIRDGYDPQLDELIAMATDGRSWLARLEAREKEATGINSLKVRYNKVFGYYIEVPKSQGEKVPAHYLRKQTLVNAERFVTDELKELESKVLHAEERRAALEYAIFCQLRQAVADHNSRIQAAARFIARLDCLLGLAQLAEENGYHRPELNVEGHLLLRQARHPVIETLLSGERFVPNTIAMDDAESQVLIITGPNMAGKSTVLRQTALLVLMAQMGSFIPADPDSTVPVTDRIFTRVGALDNLSQGQSTFMVEMQETANILNNASCQSLVILDEIGRGTSTYDGISLAWAVAEYLHDLKGKGVKTLFATHYHELTQLALTKQRVKNYNIAVKEKDGRIVFLRKIAEGGTDKSYGIQVARLAGIPESVIETAHQVLARIETPGSDPIAGSDPESAEKAPKTEKGYRQLDLFTGSEQVLIRELQTLDIERMTPLEAINRLSELQEKVKVLN